MVVFAVIGTIVLNLGSARQAGTGVFAAHCEFTHALNDDPIVKPGLPGASHKHDFTAHRLTDAFSTGQSLLDLGLNDHEMTSCDEGGDYAAYWYPALYRDGQKLDPEYVKAYYRNAGEGNVTPFPIGLGMVAGDAYAEDPNPHVRWECAIGDPKASNTRIPTCSQKSGIKAYLKFPDCWDGINLWLPDKSHVKYGRCGASHPIRIPEITLAARYPSDGLEHEYKLSSGEPMTLHGDFLNAWDPEVLRFLIDKCLNERDSEGHRKDCQPRSQDPPQCSDFIDNDGDAMRDFSVAGYNLKTDPGCSDPSDDSEYAGTNPQCSNNRDDDGDGRADERLDPGCAGKDDDNERDPAIPQCSDGQDNDGDVLIDYPVDLGCSGRPDTTE